MFCSHCGAAVQAHDSFCGSCGSAVARTSALVGTDGKPIGISAPQMTVALTPPISTEAPPHWRGASEFDITRAKHLTDTDWDSVHTEFYKQRKAQTLTPIGCWLGHNAAWDGYFAGCAFHPS